LSDSQRRFEKLIVDERSLDNIALEYSDLVSLITDFRGQARELNDLVDSYVRIAESKIEYLQMPDRHPSLTVPLAPHESEQLQESRKWKNWTKNHTILIDLKRKKLLELGEKLKASLDSALEHAGVLSE
jgi:hypothetical protein